MKRLFITLAFVFALLCDILAAAVSCKTEIKDVTVYKRGAMVKRSGSFTVPSGRTTLRLTGLTTEYDQSSIQVGFSDMGITIYSIEHDTELNYSTTKKDSIKLLEKQVAKLQDSLSVLKNMPLALKEEKAMILSNKELKGTDKTLTVAELRDMSNFFRERLTEIDKKLFECETNEKIIYKELNKKKQELDNLYTKDERPYNVVVVELESKKQTTAKVNLQYFVEDAKWTPAYNANVSDVDNPLQLLCRARINQKSKEDWKNVKLHLSTEDPFISNAKPAMNVYNLPIMKDRKPIEPYKPFAGEATKRVITGVVRDDKEPIPFANVLVKGTTRETHTDMDGKYSIEVDNGDVLEFSFSGYETKEVKINNYTSSILNVELELPELNEVVVVGYGKRRGFNFNRETTNRIDNALAGRVSGVRVTSTNDNDYLSQNMATSVQLANYNADIELPATIPSDEKEHEVSIKEDKIECNYIYSAVPKLSERVYLVAEIPNWGGYHYQNGKMSVYLKNMYLGDSELNNENTCDTFGISLGADREIAISRTEEKSVQSKQFIGTMQQVEKTWKITVQNKKKMPVEVTIDDQYPISLSDDIKVTLTDKGGAEVQESDGRLRWKVKLGAGEKKEIKFTYTVKYPKKMRLVVE